MKPPKEHATSSAADAFLRARYARFRKGAHVAAIITAVLLLLQMVTWWAFAAPRDPSKYIPFAILSVVFPLGILAVPTVYVFAWRPYRLLQKDLDAPVIRYEGRFKKCMVAGDGDSGDRSEQKVKLLDGDVKVVVPLEHYVALPKEGSTTCTYLPNSRLCLTWAGQDLWQTR